MDESFIYYSEEGDDPSAYVVVTELRFCPVSKCLAKQTQRLALTVLP